MEVVASLSQGRTAAAQCGLFTYKSVPIIFEPPCNSVTCNTVWPGSWLRRFWRYFCIHIYHMCAKCLQAASLYEVLQRYLRII